MGWGEMIGAIVDAGAANKQAAAADDATTRQLQAGKDAMGFDLAMYNQGRQDNLNALVTGNSAVNMLARMMGLDYYTGQVNTNPLTMSGGETKTDRQSFGEWLADPGGFYYGQRSSTSPITFSNGSGSGGGVAQGSAFGGGTANGGSPDYSAFWKSPDYNVAMSEGLRGLTNSSNDWNPGGFGGRTDMDRMQYASNLGTQTFNNFTSRLMGIAGFGSNAAGNTGGLGQSTAGRVTDTLNNRGLAQANGLYGAANAYTNLAGNLSDRLSGWNGDRSGYQSGMSGGGGGGFGNSLLGKQAGSGQGSMWNFGNNVSGFWGS